MEAFSTIYVRTHNSEYEIFLLDPESGRALVQGGRYFAETLEATACGSTFGGCMLKLGWIGVGLRLEVNVNGQRFVTSPVQSVRVRHQAHVEVVQKIEESRSGCEVPSRATQPR